MNALVDAPDAGDVMSIGRRYRAACDRLGNLDHKWVEMADEAPGKWEAAAAAWAVKLEGEHLLLAVFRRRTETVADIAVTAAHAFTVLDRADLEAPGVVLVLRAMADIATTAAKMAGLDFSMIGPPDLPARLRACLGR